jgi:Tol biopolymer transport system component
MHFDPANTAAAYVAPDGSRIVFGALQLVAGQKHWHVIARNVRTNQFSRVDISPSGQLANGDVRTQGLSADGLHVLFSTTAANFGTRGRWEAYERDLTTHRTVLVAVPPAGQQWANPAPFGVSRDGRFVVLVVFTGKLRQVWLRDVVAHTTTLVSRAVNGDAGNGESLAADVSPDGSYVVFDSSSSNLVSDDTNGKSDVFLWTRATGAIKRISVASDGKQLAQGSSAPRFTTDGSHLVFGSDAQLTSDACQGGADATGDSDNGRNAYVLDLKTGGITHPKQPCSGYEQDNSIHGSDGGATLAIGVLHTEVNEVVVRRNGTQRNPGYVAASPTSVTANGRFVGIDHYDPVDNPPSDKAAGALIWDLSRSQPAAAWLVQTTQ